ncbi:MAG: PIN domain-containing protein [Gemmatimonadaceae bacterium]
MIVADTGAIIALVDSDDRHHASLVNLYDADPAVWVLPWAILPEVDYLLASRVGEDAARAFRADLASGAFTIVWGVPEDLARAHALCVRYADLALGLVDGVVAAVAERLRASAIATLDLRDFGPLVLKGAPKLFPRDQV